MQNIVTLLRTISMQKKQNKLSFIHEHSLRNTLHKKQKYFTDNILMYILGWSSEQQKSGKEKNIQQQDRETILRYSHQHQQNFTLSRCGLIAKNQISWNCDQPLSFQFIVEKNKLMHQIPGQFYLLITRPSPFRKFSCR